MLCAGFPCLPVSKSGAQRGMDETRGTLDWNILQIIERRRPAVVLLENVRNLAGPRHRHEWQVIIETLRDEGYQVSDDPAIFSPHLLPPDRGGRPQCRERVFITASRLPEGREPDIDVEPAGLLEPVAGRNPHRWELEGDLPLDDDQDVLGCELSEDEIRWISVCGSELVKIYNKNTSKAEASWVSDLGGRLDPAGRAPQVGGSERPAGLEGELRRQER